MPELVRHDGRSGFSLSRGGEFGQALAEGVGIGELAFERGVAFDPDRDRRGEARGAGGGEQDAATAPIVRIGLDRDQALALERLQRGGKRGPVRAEQGGERTDRGGHRPVQGHQQRKLRVGEPDRAEQRIEAPRQHTRRALRMQAEAGVAHVKRGLEGNRSVHISPFSGMRRLAGIKLG